MDEMQVELPRQVSQQSICANSNSKKSKRNKHGILKTTITNKKKRPKKPLVDLRRFEVFTALPIEKTLKFPICNGETGFSIKVSELVENFILYPNLQSDLVLYPTGLSICKQEYENLLENKYRIMSMRVRFGMDVWDLASRLVNPYENLPCVASRVLNRAFFKMWEILMNFDLVPAVSFSHRFVSVHLCEGPGGFIQAVRRFRNISAARVAVNNDFCHKTKKISNSFQQESEGMDGVNSETSQRREDVWFALTLASSVECSTDKTSVNRSFNPQVDIKRLEEGDHGCSKGYVHYGADQTGNIMNPANISSFVDYVMKCNKGEKVGFITADGALDASDDFSLQEQGHLQLAFCEICTAVRLQAKGGAFILKFFDCFYESTVTLLMLLGSLYKHVEIVRLRTTRICSSERYVVAREFHGLTHHVEERLMTIACALYHASQNGETVGLRLLDCAPTDFHEALLLCNTVIAEPQDEAITKAIHVASVLGELVPDTFDRRQRSMSMLRRKTRVLNTMNQNAYALCNDLNIPLRNEHRFSIGSDCDS